MISPHDAEVRLRETGIERLALELRPDPAEGLDQVLA